MDWQSLAAIGIVLVVALLFALRALRRRPGDTCGGGCGCGPAKKRTKIDKTRKRS